MKSWFRFFGLSFFSDKIAKEARIRGVLNCVLGFIFSLVFVFCGVLAANTVPFYSHYKNSSDFRNFIHNFVGTANLKVENGLVSDENVINTFVRESDAAKYSLNGYNLVLDTRRSDALDDFEAYCTAKDGEADDITYEEYLALSDEDKSNYEFQIRYTENELELNGENIKEYENYLVATENSETAEKYAKLKENKPNVTEEEYQKSVYTLYVHAYYPEITKFEREDQVPLLRSYYFVNYLSGKVTEKSLFIFDNLLIGYYSTDSGLPVTFYGSYEKISDGALTVDGADKFIKQTFESAVPLSANVYLYNIFRFIPLIAAIPLILALISKIALSLIKDVKYKNYITCLKIEFSFMAWSAFFTAVIMFVLGFFISGTVLNALPLIILSGVMFVRTVVLLIGEYIIIKKIPPEPTVEAEGFSAAETDINTAE